jgi:hypothetical protein
MHEAAFLENTDNCVISNGSATSIWLQRDPIHRVDAMRLTTKFAVAIGLSVISMILPARVHGAAKLDPRRIPTTQPHASKFPLPPALAILGQRSLFSKNGIPAAVVDGAPPRPEASMALRGITLDENSFVAFIEDTISHRTLTLHQGEGVASGHIQNLSLDELAFESGNKVLHISVGQNLLGGLMPVAVAPPPPPPAAPAGGPEGMPPGAMPPGMQVPPNGQRAVRNAPPPAAVPG